ncbi:MAG TPA: hypothetical protein VK894_02360 [Jiangellales bacterium]|nr:hypothetical protein [Jiangellales bacterium]
MTVTSWTVRRPARPGEPGSHGGPVRVCLAYSPGGHCTELRKALEQSDLPPAVHVSFRPGGHQREEWPDAVRYHWLVHPRRNLLRLTANLLQALVVVLRERPQVVVASGADVTVAFVILAKLLCRAHVVFIESGGELGPTLSGRLCYPFSDYFVVQWPEQAVRYPRAVGGWGALL